MHVILNCHVEGCAIVTENHTRDWRFPRERRRGAPPHSGFDPFIAISCQPTANMDRPLPYILFFALCMGRRQTGFLIAADPGSY